MIEDQKILKHEEKIANTLNKYFSTLTKKLKLKPQKKLRTSKKEIKKIINSFKDNPSIKKIKSHFLEDEVFSFREVTNDEILDAIKSLPTNKSSTFDDIPAKLLKDSAVIYSPILMKIFNNCLREGKFPDILKYSDITPVFKKGENTKKENYRPISSLSNFSKIFEKLIHSQISQFIESKLSDYLTGFRRNHNTQYALLEMIEKWKTFINRGFKVGALMMDLSKAFDTLNHYLLISKLEAYGFDERSITFIKSYFTDRYQRTKVGNEYSSWRKVTTGVPQGSILGPLFFNIFINDMFLFTNKCFICNYADDNTLYACNKDENKIMQDLLQDFTNLSNWFYENYLVLNADKCHFMTLGFKSPRNNHRQ